MIVDANDRNRIAWENRSRLFGVSLKGVLFKGLPLLVNEHIHNWHKRVVLAFAEGEKRLEILDVGCGYGRLSLPLIEKFPNADINGLDISENYVKIYEQTTKRRAFVGTIENVSPEFGTFDYILCVTVLMYLDNGKLKEAASRLLDHLKPDGKIILIEPHISGSPFQTGFGLLTFLRDRIQKETLNTGGRYFRSREIEDLFGRAGGKVLSEERLPITSLFFLPLTLVAKYLPEGIGRSICKRVALLDTLLGKFKWPSIHVAYLIARS
jgi:2-polyprenyl-3-methyl-5-hydroxy-6-metoxy-1,4-benzoquinol methylase